MSAIADKCAMCGDPIGPVVTAYSEIFKGPVCADCAECIRNSVQFLKHVGQRAEISGETPDQEKP